MKAARETPGFGVGVAEGGYPVSLPYAPEDTAFIDCDMCGKQRLSHHPNMVPYAELSEKDKDYDRRMVETVLSALEPDDILRIWPGSIAVKMHSARRPEEQ